MNNTCFVIGSPVEHSLSPGMHRIIYDQLNLDWEYLRKEIINENMLKDFADEARKEHYRGFNVTIPHKQMIMRYLDDLSVDARRIGAVNTVKQKSGKLKGYNTDWKGFLDDLNETLGVNPAGKTVLIAGCGGGARAVLEAIRAADAESGTQAEVYVFDIDEGKASAFAGEFKGPLNISAVVRPVFREKLSGAALLVNASPAGMKKNDELPIELDENVSPELAVYDLVYNRKTRLLKKASSLGLNCTGGAGMLAGQGLEAFKIWYEKDLEPGTIRMLKNRIIGYLEKEVLEND